MNISAIHAQVPAFKGVAVNYAPEKSPRLEFVIDPELDGTHYNDTFVRRTAIDGLLTDLHNSDPDSFAIMSESMPTKLNRFLRQLVVVATASVVDTAIPEADKDEIKSIIETSTPAGRAEDGKTIFTYA